MVLSRGPLVVIFLWSRLALYDNYLFVVSMNNGGRGGVDNLNMCSVIVMPVVWLVVR